MGTEKLAFEGVLWERATGSDVTGSDVSHVTGRDVSHAPKGSNFRHVTTTKKNGEKNGPCAKPTSGQCHFRTGPLPVTWLCHFRSEVVTWRKFDPFGVPLGVRMRNWKLTSTRCDRRSRYPFGSVLGVFSTTSAYYNHRKPCVLYLAWWLELDLVICPFYFRIVSI
jgi:hypothetical protein